MTEGKKSFFDRWYRILFLIPIIILIFSLVYLGLFYQKNHEIIYKDVSLSGGTTISLTGNIDQSKLEPLKQKYSDLSFRKITDFRTGENIALIVESSATPAELKQSLEDILGYKLTAENSSTEFTGPTLSNSFYSELLKIIFISFLLMALVIFMIFGESKITKASALISSLAAIKLTFPSSSIINIFLILVGVSAIGYGFIKSKTKKEYLYTSVSTLFLVFSFILQYYFLIFIIAAILFIIYFFESLPSIAVVFCAFADIVFALAAIDLLGLKISSAGIAAFLMLIGYSVDTDILLTTRAMKEGGGLLNDRIFSAFKTGFLMTATALAAILPAFFIVSGLPDSFRQIFLILALGLGADLINTWITNVGIIKWYCKKRGIT